MDLSSDRRASEIAVNSIKPTGENNDWLDNEM